MIFVYVGNLSYEVETRDLEEEFGKFGRIELCAVKRGFAFIHFVDPQDAKAAVDEMDNRELRGRRLKVAFAMSNGEGGGGGGGGDSRRDRGDRGGGDNRRDPLQVSPNLFVANIPPQMKMRELEEFFERYGKVENVKILPQARGNLAMSAFVDFSDVAAAQKAHESELVVDGQRLRTDYNFRGIGRPRHDSYEDRRSYGDTRSGRGGRDDDYDTRRPIGGRDRSRDRSRDRRSGGGSASGYDSAPRSSRDLDDGYSRRPSDRGYRERSPQFRDRRDDRDRGYGQRSYDDDRAPRDNGRGMDDRRPLSRDPPRRLSPPRDISGRRGRSMSPPPPYIIFRRTAKMRSRATRTAKANIADVASALASAPSQGTLIRQTECSRFWIQGLVVRSDTASLRCTLDDGTATATVDMKTFLKNTPNGAANVPAVGDYVMVIGPMAGAQHSADQTTLTAHQVMQLRDDVQREAVWWLEVIEYWTAVN
ncbi:TPA: hypothetical protein N0F65_001526 [Lagenidium giganteum]|uniref:RRM domain-containing protein n=1 Tax=Lagenidium giganteum TaxID=4803 RepID=A0AAV2Z204_9STRA|nr:TPA: hypothetical protein N0F65_001526 [Lagenidium giganteum]